ncbi:MAG: T9SS type A sorting domain-containing protein [Thermoanaerobaculia bacterium]|nr:T9SS type A sorting domain-containing protein [Thermoanaerobaculia bacterium]
MTLRNFSFAFFCAAALTASAQSSGFAGASNSWYIEEVFTHPDNKTYYSFETGGDTILQGILYRKLHKGPWLSGAVREDSAGTVYYVDFQGLYVGAGPNRELELYKFGAAPGDSTVFRRSSDSLKIKYVVTAVDSADIYGAMRRTLQVIAETNGYYSDTWIAGIGSAQMPLLPLEAVTEYGWTLLCFNHVNDAGESCLMAQKEAYRETDITLAPNPASTYFEVTMPPAWWPAIRSVRLFDTAGRIRLAAGERPPFRLETAHLPPGVYVLEIRVGTSVLRKKVVK